jgi:signal transduction histidine kinase
MRELRNYIFQLRPHQAASMGLRRGLAELAREYEVNALVRPELHLPADLDARVAESVVPDLLQIVREALSNVAKHADASTVVLQARLAPGSLVLVVVDDGRGFVPGGAVVGRGLENIRGRAAALGADLEVVSSPGDGTTVSVRLSLPDSRHLPPTPGADRGAPA